MGRLLIETMLSPASCHKTRAAPVAVASPINTSAITAAVDSPVARFHGASNDGWKPDRAIDIGSMPEN